MIIYTFFIKNLTPNNKLLKLVWKWDTIIALDDCRFDNSNPSGFFLFVMIFWKKIVLHLKIAKYAHHWIFKIILLLSKILILISLVLNFLIQLFLIDDPNLLQKIFKKSSGRKKNYLSRKKRPALIQNIRLNVKLQSVKISLEAKNSSKIYLVILVNNWKNTKYMLNF